MDTNIFQDYAKKKVTNYLDTNYIRPLQKNIQGIKSNIRTDVQNTLNPGLSVGMQGAAFRAASPTTTPTSQVNVKSTPKSAAPVARAKVKSTKSPEQKYQEDLSRQISDSYKAQINFLTQQEQAAQAGLPGQLESIGQQYEAFLPELQSQLTQQQQAGATQQESLRMQEQQALAAGRRGAEEASQRAVQQFGGVGGSSAGQAASEIIGREQLKQAGSVQQQRVAGIENVNTQLRAIQSEYNSNVNKLQL